MYTGYMEIQNLNPNPIMSTNQTPPTPFFSLPIILIVVFLGLATGFWTSRIKPQNKKTSTSMNQKGIISSDKIENISQIEIGKIYGQTSKSFKDTATGVIEKGSINGEGTHILNREGGASQRASLISSAIDLDLFVGKKVEIKGETNASTKTSWLIDVGSIKVLE
jgi:hypothetical protein